MNEDSKIILYGNGTYGQLAYKLFSYIGKKPFAICDRKIALRKKHNGVLLVTPEELKDYRDYNIYITTKNFYKEIYNELKDRKFNNVFNINFLLNMDIDIDKIALTDKEKDAWEQRKKYVEVINQSLDADVYIVHLEVVITERCSLRCKQCSSLMPFYNNPNNIDIKSIINDLKKIAAVIDRIGEIRILGGEPFLNPQISELISYLAQENKFGNITIYTNGTVMPDFDTLCNIKENKIFVHVSDYGIQQTKREQFIARLKENNIKYMCRQYDSWFDFGEIKTNNMGNAELQEMFDNCSSAQCFTLHRGRIYHCPRSAHAHVIGAVDLPNADYIEVNDIELKERIIEFTQRKEYIHTCRFCTGTNGELIKPAIQIGSP